MIKTGYIVSRTRKGKDGHIIHELKDSDVASYTVIRGGLSLPVNSSPAYYCLFGEDYDRFYDYRHQETRRPLKFLADGEAGTLDGLFDSLTDDAVLLGCETVYTDPNREDYMNYLRDRLFGKHITLGLDAAPFAGDFQVGMGLIEGWRSEGAFTNAGIPSESILDEQIRRITKEDFADNPEICFYAVNAFRYLIGGFQKNPWRPTRGQRRHTTLNWRTV